MSPWSHHLKKRGEAARMSCKLCDCTAPYQIFSYEPSHEEADSLEQTQVVPISQKLYSELCSTLNTFLQNSTSFSVLLLHISQVESPPLAPKSSVLYNRPHYHAPANLLSQVMANVQRAIRINDKMLMYEDAGMAIVFADVNQQGLQRILERVHNSISLLQAETLIPPLTRETTIVLGGGTYLSSTSSLAELALQVSRVTHSLTLRPVITTQLKGVKPMPVVEAVLDRDTAFMRATASKDAVSIPYMELPGVLPPFLTHLIPHQMALELQCAPVGRDHRFLTVAMLDPTNEETLRRLRQMTGLTIFPVTCSQMELNNLLSEKW